MSRIQIDLVSKGSDNVVKDVATIDQALSRSSATAKANAAEVEAALSKQIRKREDLRRQIQETEAALSKSKAGSEEFEKFEQQLSELGKAEKAAAAGVRDLSRDAKEAAKAVALTADSVNGLKARLKEAKAIADRSEFGTDEFKKATAEAKRLEKELDDLRRSHKENERAVDAHVNSLKALERELEDNAEALRLMDRSSPDFDKQRRKVDQLTASLNKARKGTVSAGGDVNKSIDKFIAGVAGFATVVATVTRAAAAIQEGIDKLQGLREGDRNDRGTFEAVSSNVRSNFKVDDGGRQFQQATNLAIRQAALGVTTLTPSEFIQALGDNIALAGGDLKKTAEAVIAASRQFPTGPQIANSLSSASLQFAEQSGAAVKAATGALLRAQSQSKASDVGAFSSAFGGTVKGARQSGLSGEEALEEAAAFSFIVPKSLDQAATVFTKFTKSINTFQGEASKTLKTGEVSNVEQSVLDQFAKSTGSERIRLLEQNQALAKQFAETGGEFSQAFLARFSAPEIERINTIRANVQVGAGSERFAEQNAAAQVQANPTAISNRKAAGVEAATGILNEAVDRISATAFSALSAIEEREEAAAGIAGIAVDFANSTIFSLEAIGSQSQLIASVKLLVDRQQRSGNAQSRVAAQGDLIRIAEELKAALASGRLDDEDRDTLQRTLNLIPKRLQKRTELDLSGLAEVPEQPDRPEAVKAPVAEAKPEVEVVDQERNVSRVDEREVEVQQPVATPEDGREALLELLGEEQVALLRSILEAVATPREITVAPPPPVIVPPPVQEPDPVERGALLGAGAAP